MGTSVAGRDAKRYVDVVHQELSRRAVTRQQIRDCFPEADLGLKKIEQCAAFGDNECRFSQQEAEEINKLEAPALRDVSNPSFLQAAIFFITGLEPPKFVQMLSDKKAIVLDSIVTRRGSLNVQYQYEVMDDNACTVRAFLVEPSDAGRLESPEGVSYGAKRVEFLKLPSPRGLRVLPNTNAVMDLPHETWCSAKIERMSEGSVKIISGTSMCSTGMLFVMNAKTYRRMAALDYIRANFCPGQPEPPPPPRKPY
jgi:hypothetical protein